MRITVSGNHVDLSGSLKARVSERLGVVVEKYFCHALEVRITFGRARGIFTCDIDMHAGRRLTLRGEGEAVDPYAAFDNAADHVAKRLRRYRRWVSQHVRHTAARARAEQVRHSPSRVLDEDGREGHPVSPDNVAMAVADNEQERLGISEGRRSDEDECGRPFTLEMRARLIQLTASMPWLRPPIFSDMADGSGRCKIDGDISIRRRRQSFYFHQESGSFADRGPFQSIDEAWVTVLALDTQWNRHDPSGDCLRPDDWLDQDMRGEMIIAIMKAPARKTTAKSVFENV